MQKIKLGRTWLLAGILCALPVSAVVTGCNGNNDGPTRPLPALAGAYDALYVVTQGQSTGETSRFNFRIDEDGKVSGRVTDAQGAVATFSGTVNLTTGAFDVTNVFEGSGVSGRATGTINSTTGTGSGTFQLTNGNKGTVTLQKTAT